MQQTSGAGGSLRQLLTERYRERLAGVLSCYDRSIVARPRRRVGKHCGRYH